MKEQRKDRARNRRQRAALKVLDKYGKDILNSESFLQCKNYVQHGRFSVWRHSLNVAEASVKISQTLPFQFSERELVRGALLHDYFQYDWHEKKVSARDIFEFYKMHGFIHPGISAENARRDFHIGRLETEIICKHMWPLTIKPPMCREAWVVTMADKYCSILETLHILEGDLCG